MKVKAARFAWFLFTPILAMLTEARGDDLPEFTPGTSDVVFKTTAPQSTDDELQARLGRGDSTPAYEIEKEKFRVWVPADYKHETPWGLFVWVDAGPAPSIAPDWEPLLASHKYLTVGAYNSGNPRNIHDRIRLAVDAVHNMRERFNIDPKRIIISGSSGGGRVASELGVAYADVFTGAYPIIGVNYYKPIASGEGNKSWLATFKPKPKLLATAKKKNRFVLLTGEKDFNRENTKRVHRLGYKADGFKKVLYLEVPGMSHQRPPADWFAKGLDFLE